MRLRKVTLWIVALVSTTLTHVGAFSLSGPFATWMTPEIGYRLHPDSTSAPMLLGEEYRWNLPVITYGFDPSFEAWFGAAGKAEIEAAITILNSLPPADALDPATYPESVRDIGNATAAQVGILDLRSHALGALLELLGLGNAEQSVWTIRQALNLPNSSRYLLQSRNHSPVDGRPTNRVNAVSFTYSVTHTASPGPVGRVSLSAIDPLAQHPTAAGGFAAPLGEYFPQQRGQILTGLSRDDVGGLRYLLATANRNIELLPPGVTDTNGGNGHVDLALRPGVNQVRFQAMPFDTEIAQSSPVTNYFEDRYFAGATLVTQRVMRIMSCPDIVFSAAEWLNASGMLDPIRLRFGTRTNLARFNSAVESDGPGVIFPGCVVTFNKAYLEQFNSHPFALDQRSATGGWLWGSITGPATVTATFPPVAQGVAPLTLSPSFLSSVPEIQWLIIGRAGEPMYVESSEDLARWQPEAVTSGASVIVDLRLPWTTNWSARFFRVRRE